MDIERIKKFWRRDRKRQEYHHKLVLKINKWILGFGKEVFKIAGKVIKNHSDNNGLKSLIGGGGDD